MKYTIFVSKIGKDFENLSSAAVVIGALRVKHWPGPSISILEIALKQSLNNITLYFRQ